MKKLFLICVLLVVKVYSATSDEECTAITKYGVLQGNFLTSRVRREFCAFLGIPYATPPIGKLRFLPPIPPQKWNGIRNATEEGNICLQSRSGGSEDCLYLNVFTHSTQPNESSTVMVYIHGGGFHLGSSSVSYLGPEYLMDRDIVLVTLQYRLGPFGFLSTEDEVIPGNMGLKDQVKALQWVQENIQVFGGNPGKVTIFGNSAGGASVHLHMQSPLSKDLFVRGISQSGTAVSSFAITTKGKSKKDAELLALSLNCSIYNSTEIFNCLQNKSSMEILDIFKKQLQSQYDVNKIFRPVTEVDTEHAFLTNSAWRATTEKPWLVGVNANEGIFKIKMEKINDTIKLINSEFINFGPQLMFIYDLYSNLDEIANLTHNFYCKNVSTVSIIKSLEQMVSDSWFIWPTEQAVRQHNGSLYYYLYDHQAEHTYSAIHGCPKGLGVSHTDELLVLFTQKNFFPELRNQDTNISKLMVNMWVNFASEGNPTSDSIRSNPQNEASELFIWKAANNSDPMYLHIQTNNISMKKKMFSDRMNFWRSLPLKHLVL